VIFKNEKVLRGDFLPERILFRERQLMALDSCIKPALRGIKPRNAFLHGPCGSGKTATLLWKFKRLESQVKPVYIDCWELSTMSSIMLRVLTELGILHTSSYISELLGKLKRYLERQGESVIVALDGIDGLDKRRRDKILYHLSRSSCGIVCIGADLGNLSKVDLRVRCSLQLRPIEFHPYSDEELFRILRARAGLAFHPDRIKNREIKLAAGFCGGNARLGIETLRTAALLAEEDGNKIKERHVRKAWSEVNFLLRREMLGGLSDHQKILYQILSPRERVETGDLRRLYEKRVENPVGSRCYRKYMHKLVSLGLVNCEGQGRWRVYRRNS
jgi:cell division control protein 6